MWTPPINQIAELTQWSLYINHYSVDSQMFSLKFVLLFWAYFVIIFNFKTLQTTSHRTMKNTGKWFFLFNFLWLLLSRPLKPMELVKWRHPPIATILLTSCTHTTLGFHIFLFKVISQNNAWDLFNNFTTKPVLTVLSQILKFKLIRLLRFESCPTRSDTLV
jgi:hypothetical protein